LLQGAIGVTGAIATRRSWGRRSSGVSGWRRSGTSRSRSTQVSAPHAVLLEETRALCAEVDDETPLPARAHCHAIGAVDRLVRATTGTLRAIAAGVGTAAEPDGRPHPATS